MTKIELALQGGGAKLVALLAAMEVVHDLEQGTPRKLAVTRLAGTSAGSIVACLYAAGFSMRDIRLELMGDFGKKVLRTFPPTGWFQGLCKNLRGWPVWDTQVLREYLEKKFGDIKISTVGELNGKGRPVAIVSTDLRTGRAKGYGGEENLVEATVQSRKCSAV